MGDKSNSLYFEKQTKMLLTSDALKIPLLVGGYLFCFVVGSVKAGLKFQALNAK